MKRSSAAVISLLINSDEGEDDKQHSNQLKQSNRKAIDEDCEQPVKKKHAPTKSNFRLTALQSIKMTKIAYLRSLSEQTFANTVQHMLQGDIESIIQFTYMIDVDWFMSLFPAALTCRQIKIVHGFPTDHPIVAQAEAKYPNIKMKSPRMPLPYGIHHTKALLIFYRDQTMRIIIMTANMIQQDWGYAIFISNNYFDN
jgi:tyrosyl-DNA phosphodiesterase-1